MIIKQNKFFVIKIIDRKSNNYDDDDYIEYHKFIKQVKI